MIVVVPPDTPYTTPAPETVPTAVLELLHAPPDVAHASVVVCPTQTVVVPVIEDGFALTVTTAVAWQPADELTTMVAVPAATPVTMPLLPPTVAMPVARLLQVTPGVAQESVVVCVTHTASKPVMAAGFGFTVTVAMATHPVGRVYVTSAVPAVMPVTSPVPIPTVMFVALVPQVPPATL